VFFVVDFHHFKASHRDLNARRRKIGQAVKLALSHQKQLEKAGQALQLALLLCGYIEWIIPIGVPKLASELNH
jgi:hypothetical protein